MWDIIYVQEELADIWKENIMKYLENRSLEFAMVGDFLINLKQELKNRNNKSVKVAELKKVKQKRKMMKKFIQKLRRVVRESRFEKRLLIEEFK